MASENNRFFTKKEREDFNLFGGDLRRGASRLKAGSRRKALSALTLFSFVFSACGATITPSSPDLASTSEPVPTEYIPASTPTESVPPPTEEAVAEFPEEEIKQLQEQLKAQGLETEIVENEEEFIFSDISGTKAVEIGVFRLENDQYVFVTIKSNKEEIAYPISQLGIDEEDSRFIVKDETGRINFKYYPELQKLKQEIEFPYLELSTESGRFKLIIGESMEDDVKSIEWNNDIPPLRYQDPETGEIRMLTPQERFDEAVFVAFWSLAKGSGQQISLAEIREGNTIQFEDNEGVMQEIDTGELFRLAITNVSGNSKPYQYCRVSVEKFWFETSDIGELWIHVNYGGFSLREEIGIDPAESIADFSFFSVLKILSNAEAMKGVDQPARWDYILRGHNNPDLLEIIGRLVFEYSEGKYQNKNLYNMFGPTGVAKEGPDNNLIIVQTP